MCEETFVNEYQIIHKLGSGGYGEIFSVSSPFQEGIFALKTENIESNNKGIFNEQEIIKHLPNSPHFPHIISSGETSAIYYFVMNLYGPSLGSIRHRLEGEHFSIQSTIMLGIETIKIIEELHKSEIIHCDIKPSNFLLNKSSIGGFVLIDYGLSEICNKNIKNKKSTKTFKGTFKYASVNLHKMHEPKKRDDLISWFYTIIELAKGELPWKNIKDAGLLMSYKQTITSEKLCSGLPKQFIYIWDFIKNLKSKEEPQYLFIEENLKEALNSLNLNENDLKYEWENNREIISQLTPHPELFLTTMSTDNIKENPKQIKKCILF